MYRRATPSAPIEWVDVSASGSASIAGQRCGDLMARFHVQTADGAMLSGAAAFVALWLLFPGWRWLGKFGSLPGIRHVLEWVYRAFLQVRPGIQWLFRKLESDKRR